MTAARSKTSHRLPAPSRGRGGPGLASSERVKVPQTIGSARKSTYRCAIYVRKSSEEGLDQAFNSLDAQREACEAYVKSQSHEGWLTLPTQYADGGYSGGSMDRPALKRLLDDISMGRIDTVVVYKVDRLTRSLADFAKIVEIFDHHSVSFVSVTQQFNTTTSMGRLTLNVLLSFAQFEREVTGERIRDKIAASKKKGMWMGGLPPLGYDVRDRKLVVNAVEAARVRAIYAAYLKLGTVTALARYLRKRAIHSKPRLGKDDARPGGNAFSRGALYHLLKNRAYLGEVVYQGVNYAGEHPAILTRALWEKAQVQLASNRRSSGRKAGAADRAHLSGLLFDDRGNPMSPSYASKSDGRRYRYYVSQALLQHRANAAGSLSRVSAPAIEALVQERLAALSSEIVGASRPRQSSGSDGAALHAALRRVELSSDRVKLVFAKTDDLAKAGLAQSVDGITDEGEAVSVTTPVKLGTWRGRTTIEVPAASPRAPGRDPALIKAVVRAHQWKQELLSGTARSLSDVARRHGFTARYIRQVLNLARLAPDIVGAILDGKQPRHLNVTALVATPTPLSWQEQRALFELGA